METPPRGRLSSRALDTTPPNRRAHSREPVYIRDELPLPLASPAPWKLSYGHPSMLRRRGSDGSPESEGESSPSTWTSRDTDPDTRSRDLRLRSMRGCEEDSEDEEEPNVGRKPTKEVEGNRRVEARETTTPVGSPLPSPEAESFRTPVRTRSASTSGKSPGTGKRKTRAKTPIKTPIKTPKRQIARSAVRTPRQKHTVGRRYCTRSSTRVGLRPCTRSQGSLIRGRLQSLSLEARKRPKRG